MTRIMLLAFLLVCSLATGESAKLVVNLKSMRDRNEVESLIKGAKGMPPQRRIEFISKYLLGRKYHPETRTRIKKQHAPKPAKREANNEKPLSVEFLRSNLTYLDCMTYVEHVLAMAASQKASYTEFLLRLIDVMFDAGGKPLMNHHRNHFTSYWGVVNERKGYLTDIARHHPKALSRGLYLNRVGNNRTYYIEDRFMIAAEPSLMWYFPVAAVLDGSAPLQSGDIVAMVTDKEGLDVTHMGFYIEQNQKRWLRHASLKLNRVTDQDLAEYLRAGKNIKGLMAFRPLLKTAPPALYRFRNLAE